MLSRARAYLTAREAQELDHTDPRLNDARTEAHDALLLQLDIEGVPYTDREDAARLAREIVRFDCGSLHHDDTAWLDTLVALYVDTEA